MIHTDRDDGPEPPATPIRLGEVLAALARQHGLTDDDIAAIEALRDRSPAQPMSFD